MPIEKIGCNILYFSKFSDKKKRNTKQTKKNETNEKGFGFWGLAEIFTKT
jgi:hypothetical protein